MSPVLLGVMALGGYVVYSEVSKSGSAGSNANQPDPNKPMPFWSSWGNQGAQVQTGNGAPTTDYASTTKAISDVSKFGTSLVAFFGTSNPSGDSSSSGSGGGSGYKLTDDNSDPSSWSMPQF